MSTKTSLGKGLGAMFPELLKRVDERPSYIQCGIEELTPNRFQARKSFRDQEQKNLVASIRKSGVIQPIVVRRAEEGYEIIAGERRWRAAQQAGLKEVPVVIREAGDLDAAEWSIVENIQRESLNPVEEADAFRILTEQFGLSQEEIALRVAKDRSTVANSLRLLRLPAEILEGLTARKISAGHARCLLSLEQPPVQLQAYRTILQQMLSVRETERLVKGLLKQKGSKDRKKEPAVSSHLRQIEHTLAERFLSAVRIRPGRKSGRIEIRFSGEEELNRLIRLLLDGKS
ncbi:MAG: ParB/RepB/Spo0J family partition protein [Syntrophales bacterium]